MKGKEKAQERERRDWIIILIILLIGFLCVILAGEQAIRFSPRWRLDTNMRSNLDPNSDFLTNRPDNYYEPVDSSILTQQIRINNFLTPGALFEINTSQPSSGITNTPVETNTPAPTLLTSPTVVSITNTPVAATPSPTNTLIYYPPLPSTNTPKPPPPPTNTPLPIADLAITKTDLNSSYIPGGTVTYTITVVNNGPRGINGAVVTDTFDTSSLNNITWTCAYTGGASSTCAGSGNINDSVNLPNGATVVYTVSADIAGSATGNLVNTASVSLPAGFTDPVPGNNSSTDTDTVTTVSADLSITKTDVPSSTTYTPGGSITYSIVVSNPVASTTAVTGATVTDTFDATRLNTITWTCSASAGSSCTASGSGNVSDTVNLAIGGTVTYTVTAKINSAATGNLVNTATVSAPAGVYDPDTINNSATDTDTAAPIADLQIAKTDNATNYVANSLKTYTITVTNAGPSDVTGATVTDIFSTNTNLVALVPWGCSSTNGGSCTPNGGIGDINNKVNLPSGSSVIYTVFAFVVNNPSGDLVNIATITAPTVPVAVTDPDTTNNSATDTDIANIDLQITKTDSVNTYTAGGSTTYTVTVTNNSTFNLSGITVSDPKPAQVLSWGWCIAPCTPTANTSANLNDNAVNLAANASITYNILANIDTNVIGNLDNTATVAVPSGYVDAVPSNNSATDSNINLLVVGPPDNSVYPIPDGGSATFYLSQPINADGLTTPDFAYYELGVGANIFLDQIIVYISMDGMAWYPVFYWGNGAPDTNSNVSAFCPGTEDDNCTIPQSSLYNNTGITIDVDNSPLGPVPTGNYYWIKFTEPGLGSTDGTHVDTVEILP